MTEPRDPIRGSILVVLATLGDRLDSMDAALKSVRQEVDGDLCTVVVVAPTSATAARALAEEHGAVVVDDPGKGLSAAVNAGIGAAAGEMYFAWLGDDDAVLPGGYSLLRRLLADDLSAVVAYGACEYMDDSGRVFGVSRFGRAAALVQPWGPNLVPQPASLCRLDAIKDVGGYDENLRLAMDLDMFLRLRRTGRFVATRTSVARYRWHPEALTVSQRGRSLQEARAIRRRYLPRWLRPVSAVWEVPTEVAMAVASRRLSARRAS